MSEEVTFRDFAGALMGGDKTKAATVLEALLGVDGATAASATAHFGEQMAAGPAFLQKAMGMRQVVENRDEAALATLLVECFGLSMEAATSAAATVLARYR
jgi:hypothetical protein